MGALRLRQTPWLATVVTPLLAVAAAMAVLALLMAASGIPVWSTYQHVFSSAFGSGRALTSTLTFAVPLMFTGLAFAVAWRARLANIGGEGQLYWGAVASSGVGLALGGQPALLSIPAMIAAGALAGAIWALVPTCLRVLVGGNEFVIFGTLMLNYVAGYALNYLIFDSRNFWRDPAYPTFPTAKQLSGSSVWPSLGNRLVLPLGLILAVALSLGIWFLYRNTRFGYQMRVLGSGERVARYEGIPTRRLILAIMALSGAVAGLAGASLMGDFAHQLEPTGLQQAQYGYTGIVVAAAARVNPLLVCPMSVLLGGLWYGGFALQGNGFPSGLPQMLMGLALLALVRLDKGRQNE